METPAGASPEGATPASSSRSSGLGWRIARYVLLVFVSAALSKVFHVEFVHRVSDRFVDYASELQPLALAGDFFSIVFTGDKPEARRSYSESRSMAEKVRDIADHTNGLHSMSPPQSLVGALMRIPRATWYVLKTSLSQGWVSFVAIVLAIVLGFRSALRSSNGPDVGFLQGVITIAAAPAIGIVLMSLLLLAAVGVAALTTSLVSFFSVIFSPAVLVGSVEEERIHSLAELRAQPAKESRQTQGVAALSYRSPGSAVSSRPTVRYWPNPDTI